MGTFLELCRRKFHSLGFLIGKHTKFFIAAPIFGLLLLSLGILKFNYDDDILNLDAVSNGVFRIAKQELGTIFPQNSSMKFTPSRKLDMGRFASVFVLRKDGGSILNAQTWSEILEIDTAIQDVVIDWEEISYNYTRLCASWNGDCFQNDHLEIGNILNRVENGSLRLNYPVMFNPVTFQLYAMNQLFGGILLVNGSSNTIESIKIVSLNYFLRNDTEDDDEKGRLWETAVIERLSSLNDRLQKVKVIYTTFTSVEREPEKVTSATIPYFSFSIVLMTVFVMGTSLTGNWVTSKPWVALSGLISANMGTLASLGVICIIGAPYLGLLNAVPFIAIGIGVDDTFVMLAAWWKTSRKDSVPQRMAECYSEAGVSITITSLTDMLCFYVGILCPIPSLQIFCFYAGTSVFFIYIFQLFFFGGILALSGYGEEENRHSLIPWRKLEVNVGDGKGTEFENTTKDKIIETMSGFLASFLDSNKSKILVFMLYITYIMISVCGLLHLKEGFARKNSVIRNSHVYDYYTTLDEYFREYPARYQVIITASPPLDYSKIETQEKVLNVLNNITHLEYMTSEYKENWLSDFLRFLDNYKEFYEFNVTTEVDFIETLRSYYIHDKMYYSEDIKFNEDFTKIVASRFIVSSHNVKTQAMEKELLQNLQKVANGIHDMKVTIFNPWNIHDDITLILRSMTVSLISVATLIVLIVTFTFIPSVASTILIFFSIASIEFGVIGFMSLWGISLDHISLVNLIMCIGFSIDLPLHIYYAYMSSTFDTPKDKIKETFHSLGFPVLQGAISTIIAASGLLFIDCYMTHVFFKIVFLVMSFVVFNGLLVLPTLLLLFNPKSDSLFAKTKSYSVN